MVGGVAATMMAILVGLTVAAAATASGVGPSATVPGMAATLSPPSPPDVVGFWLVNATSGRWLRRLDYETAVDVGAVGPFSIAVAAVAGRGGATPTAVVYTAPKRYAHVERGRPFLLAGADATGRPRRVELPIGTHAVTAIATAPGGGAGAPTTQSVGASVRLILYDGRRPPVGPLAGDLPVPPRPAGCAQLPNVSTMAGYTPDWDVGAWVGNWHAHYCPGARFRWRLFVGPLGMGHPPRRVRQAVFRVSPGFEPGEYTRVPHVFMELRRSCWSKAVWSEVCVSVDGVPACTTGGVGILAALPPPVVTLAFPSPPHAVHLAPGDAMVLKTRLQLHRDTGNVGIGPGPPIRMVGVVQRLDSTSRRSAVVTNGTVFVNRLLSRGVSAADDGATVYVEVSRLDCPAAIADTSYAGHTRLTVSPDVAPLMQPDSAAPSVPVISFPPTVYGKAANVTAVVKNPGRGYRLFQSRGRKVRVPTTLSWQWNRQFFTHGPLPTSSLPDKLTGQTGPVLRIPSVGCDTMLFCGRSGCPHRRLYTVEVCNTAGCVRSSSVAPAVLQPANAGRARWLEENKGCSWVGRKRTGGSTSPA